jgi:hypothetical protein
MASPMEQTLYVMKSSLQPEWFDMWLTSNEASKAVFADYFPRDFETLVSYDELIQILHYWYLLITRVITTKTFITTTTRMSSMLITMTRTTKGSVSFNRCLQETKYNHHRKLLMQTNWRNDSYGQNRCTETLWVRYSTLGWRTLPRNYYCRCYRSQKLLVQVVVEVSDVLSDLGINPLWMM